MSFILERKEQVYTIRIPEGKEIVITIDAQEVFNETIATGKEGLADFRIVQQEPSS